METPFHSMDFLSTDQVRTIGPASRVAKSHGFDPWTSQAFDDITKNPFPSHSHSVATRPGYVKIATENGW